MYRGKYLAPKTRRPHGKKAALLLASMALLLVVGTVGTVAYLTDMTNQLPNSFTPGAVACQVNRADSTPGADGTVKNTGTVDAYVRVAVVVNWVTGDTVLGEAPTVNDYTLSPNTGWEKIGDYYYYTKPLEPGNETPVIGIQQNGQKDGYTLQLTLLAQAIQADGVNANNTPAVEDAWKVVTIGENRELVAKS